MQSAKSRTGLLAFAFVAGFLILISTSFGVYVFAKTGNARQTSQAGSDQPPKAALVANPREAKEGEEWTLRDIAAFLQSKGIIPADATINYENFAPGTKATIDTKSGNRLFGMAKIQSPSSAKDFAAAAKGEARHSWGRFAFYGNQKSIDAITRELQH